MSPSPEKLGKVCYLCLFTIGAVVLPVLELILGIFTLEILLI